MVMRSPAQTPPPSRAKRVGRKIKTPGGNCSRTWELISQYLGSSAHDKSVADNLGILGTERASAIFSTTTVVVPAASNTPAVTAIVVFALVHAIIFNAPLMRVKVEAEALAPFARATTAAVLASDAEATWTEWVEMAVAKAPEE